MLIQVYGRSLPEAYHIALERLKKFGDKVPCPDWNTECLDSSVVIEVDDPMREPMISRCFPGGPYELEQYRQEMLDGILDFEIERGKWSYTYHDRMAQQIPFVIDELRRNPYSRRAVIQVRDWQHDAFSDDPACLQMIQYFIRKGKYLDCIVTFRSNDAIKAAYMNMFALVMLQKRIADELGVYVGKYIHIANSFHCYARDYDTLDGYLKRITFGTEEDVTYRYKGEWDELMEEEKPKIAEMVKELKNR